MKELSIVIPTYNEKDNIAILIRDIEQALDGIDFEIVVVDDNSPDGTGKIVQELSSQNHPVRLLTKMKKEGIGAALREGYRSCTTPIIASTDADLSFNPQDLKKLYNAIKGGLDLVVGTRHSKGSYYETPNRQIWIKHMVSLLGNRTLKLLTGIPLEDFSGNFRAFTKQTWQKINTQENTNTLLFEMILKAYFTGCTVGQIPVTFHDRKFGSSKLKLSLEAPKFFLKLLRYLFIYRKQLIKRRRYRIL